MEIAVDKSTVEAFENIAAELKLLRETIEEFRIDFQWAVQNDKLASPVSRDIAGEAVQPQESSVVAERAIQTPEKETQLLLSFQQRSSDLSGEPQSKPSKAKGSSLADVTSVGDSLLLANLVGSRAAAKLLAEEFSIADLDSHGREKLGVGRAAYRKLMSAIELGKRAIERKEQRGTREKISSSSDAIEFCKLHFARLIRERLQEEFHVVTLTTKNQVIDTHQITVGTLDASLVHPREVFRPAIRDAASSILLAHNHPSGDPSPSKEDFAVTSRLEDAGRTIGIDVLDHIVMGRDGVISIREER